MRWDLITRFEVLKRGVSSRAVKSYSGREDFFSEHFPGKPQVPQPFFVEMIAQAGGALFGLGLDFRREVVLAKIEDAEFYREVAPPCDLLIDARIEDEREDGAWISGVVTQNGEKVAQAKILLAAVEGLVDGKKNIVFNEHFMKKYNILAIAKKSQEVRVS